MNTNREAFLVDQSHMQGPVQLGVGLFVLYQRDTKVGEVFVEPGDPNTSTEHWGLYREYRSPSSLNTEQDLRFEYVGDGGNLSGPMFKNNLPSGSTYVSAACRQEVIR